MKQRIREYLTRVWKDHHFGNRDDVGKCIQNFVDEIDPDKSLLEARIELLEDDIASRLAELDKAGERIRWLEAEKEKAALTILNLQRQLAGMIRNQKCVHDQALEQEVPPLPKSPETPSE